MKCRQFTLILSFFAGLTGCLNAASEIPKIALRSETATLQQWCLIGPWEAKRGEAAIDVDFLSMHGLHEAVPSRSQLDSWIDQIKNDGSKSRGLIRAIDGNDLVDFGKLYGSEPATNTDARQTAAYAACEIVAEEAADGWLLIGSDDGCKVWLNGNLLHTNLSRRGVRDSETAIRLPLRKGVNLILIKVANIDRNWMMSARLTGNIELAAALGFSRGKILRRLLVAEGESLEFDDSVPREWGVDTRLISCDGRTSIALRIGAGAATLNPDVPRGLYELSFDSGGQRRVQRVYYGGVDDLVNALEALRMNALDEAVSLQWGVMADWARILKRRMDLKSDTSGRTWPIVRREIELSVLYVAGEANMAVNQLSRGQEPFQHQAGLKVRGFRSQIDDQILTYRLYVPSSYDPGKAALPLIVVMQTVGAAPVAYLDSLFIRKHEEAERDSRLAEKLGVAVLWPGYRARPYGNPLDFSHFEEVLAAVAKDYRLDPARLTLYGNCSAGMTAAMVTVRNSRRYAALAFDNPVLNRVKNRYDDDGAFQDWMSYRRWLLENDPVGKLAEVKGMPIWINHDGNDPDHGPLSHSVAFVELARSLGSRPKLERNRTNPPGREVITERLFTWMAQQRRVDPEPLVFGAIQSGGPLSRAFAQRFIVVEATGGTEIERAANRKLSSEFQASWIRTNYGRCRVVEDRELLPDEEQRSNLVLLGNSSTNLVWARFASQLPVTVEPSRIILGGQVYVGDNLAFQAWFPHPSVPGKKLVLIGASHSEHAVFGTLELSLDGWFDYSVWRNDSERSVLLAAERFK
jgi:hypothetical protein